MLIAWCYALVGGLLIVLAAILIACHKKCWHYLDTPKYKNANPWNRPNRFCYLVSLFFVCPAFFLLGIGCLFIGVSILQIEG